MQSITVKEYKKIKDPVYGYIPIEMQYIQSIIDTPVFQRLRRVIQTSYSPLYSSTLHNRFVHSLGVFYLGSIVADRLKDTILKENYAFAESDEEKREIVEEIVHVYRLACLLHDVGHAPFSHTGEIYYIYYKNGEEEEVSVKRLHEKVCELVNSETLKNDLPAESDSAAPHELMSAIVGVREFSDLIGNQESQEFFVRCITGYTYKTTGILEDIKNCFIGMLNSKVIDVDRLDYLIRDAYTSGFATINIDYFRLLKAITVKEYKDRITLAYRKDAVSVIENVVYAHDAEKKWIQNHPIVLYEAYIIKHILEHLGEKLNTSEAKLFSEESLSVEGHILSDGIKVSLLCDDDIIYLSKNVFSDELSKEFFDRNLRRHPVWKSEAEYEAYIRGIGSAEERDLFKECMDSFNASNIPAHPVPLVINDALLEKLEAELEEMNKPNKLAKALTRKVYACRYMKKYSQEHSMPFDYLIIPTSMFSSSFSKENLRKMLVNFEGKRPMMLKDVCRLLGAESLKEDKDFYYLFYRRGENVAESMGKIDNVAEFCKGLVESCLKDDMC
jgi:hypothetical protein